MSAADAPSGTPFFGPLLPDQWVEMIEVCPDAVLVVDANRRIQGWKRAAETMFGYDRDQAIGQDFNLLVDYAHTDDAITNAANMLRGITEGRLYIVFGCGGDRDRSKRAPMLQAALHHADQVFVTADNPRSEALSQIFDDMREGLEDLSSAIFIEDRKRAISAALDSAKSGDCILIAGKGHETFQEFDGTVIPFDDRSVARELLALKSFNVGEG